MVRQCAWCLRLIDNNGERVSLLPVPKRYEATHGMCVNCGKTWIQEIMDDQGLQANAQWSEVPYILAPWVLAQPHETAFVEYS